MDIWDANKLGLFIAFVVPGFVSLKTYELISPRAAKDASQQLIDAVAYSCINYALLLWPILVIQSSDVRTSYPTLYAAFYAFVLLIAPVSWACLTKWARTTQFVQRSLPHPTGKPWDYVFGQRKRFWVVVTLKDGKRLGGRYDSKSFASSSPATEQIFLEQCWNLNDDGGFERQREGGAGILILATDLLSLEFFNIVEGEKND
jgi:hypothetical protein